MTQREDFEYAAKAAGYCVCEIYGKPDGKVYFSDGTEWNPIDSKADSFSLMCSINANVYVWLVSTIVECPSINTPDVLEYHKGNKEAATRLAIFKAAVAVGRAIG